MMMNTRRLCALALLGVGCASAPPERFHALRSSAGDDVASSSGAGRTIVIGPAALPDVVDRPQLVIHDRTGAGAVDVSIFEQQRWAEPLRTAIARVVAEDLAALDRDWLVSTRDEAMPTPDCRVTLDVRRFEYARSGTAAIVDALWTVACTGMSRRTGRSMAREPVAGTSFDAIVAAQARALLTISRDVARALRASDGDLGRRR
jgi:uncharacterized protein